MGRPDFVGRERGSLRGPLEARYGRGPTTCLRTWQVATTTFRLAPAKILLVHCLGIPPAV
jgi:hypothetical protein